MDFDTAEQQVQVLTVLLGELNRVAEDGSTGWDIFTSKWSTDFGFADKMRSIIG